MPKSPTIVANAKVEDLRINYNKLAKYVFKIHDKQIIYCHSCDTFHVSSNFYPHEGYASGYFPICKEALLNEATDYDPRSGLHIDNLDKTIEVFRKVDVPFVESIYNKALEKIEDEGRNATAATAYQTTMRAVLALPQFKGYTFKNSELAEEYEKKNKLNVSTVSEKIIKQGVKRFGAGFANEDYEFLVNEYKDWISKYECDTKSQESIFERLTFKKWEIMKATRAGKPTDNLDKSFQSLLNTGNLTPKQAQESGLDTSHTFGELIKKWEDTRPLPEVDPDLEDVDKIGYYFNIFLGHTSKMVGLKNAFSNVYERFIKKFTVNRPQSDSDDDTEAIFDRIFGNDITNE